MATPLPRRLTAAPVVRRVLPCFVALALVLSLASCKDDEQELAGPTAEQVRAEQQAVLDKRARAVLDGDRAAFMASVDRTDKAFVARQRRLFSNLQELPLSRFAYRVEASTWPADVVAPRWGASASVPRVRVTMRLSRYDAVATTAETGFVFAPGSEGLMLVSDRTGEGKPLPGVTPQPWELTRIHVSESDGVLGIFDDRTRDRAQAVMDAVRDGVSQVSRRLPFRWKARVVTYSFAGKAVLDSFEGVPGGNIRHLGALTFPVYAAGRNKPVGMRFTILPSSIEAGQPFLGRIVRHELTHVALGERDDGVPTWVTEGIAEYVGARDLPEAQRRIASVAVQRAADGASAMPSSRAFNGAEQDWHYALSWMACDYIAETRGEAVLWRVLNRLHAGGVGTVDADQDPVLRAVLGYDSHQLARRAARRILEIYR